VSKVKACKIDQASIYPCPCSKLGQLCPIVLTDAFGCDKCQQIFVLRSDGYVLEQISHIYPYQQHWYWTGQTWRLIRPPLIQSSFALIVGVLIALFVVLIGLPMAFHIPFDRRLVVWMVLPISIALVLSFMVWLTMYRRP
jgi:hypothetical protein